MRTTFIAPIALCLWFAPAVLADTFVLSDGGRIEGEWLNRSAEPVEHYEIRLAEGGQLVLSADRVQKVIPLRPEEEQYRKWLQEMPPTAEGNWKMAVWCKKRYLAEKREFHLQETIRLDPDHKQARAVLGFRQVDGDWVLADDLMESRGFVKYKGRWRLPADIELLEQREARESKLGEWKRQIRIWQRSFGTPREAEAVASLRALSDPLAAEVIADRLDDSKSLAEVRLWIQVLGNIPSGASQAALLRSSLELPSRELRALCVDALARQRSEQVVAAYIAALGSADNLRVRRAAAALRVLGDETAIRPLIDALVTTHKLLVAPADPGRTEAAFGGGTTSSGGGFSTGGRPKVVQQPFLNREVLEALVELTGCNFQYDQAIWRAWYVSKASPPPGVNLRRRG